MKYTITFTDNRPIKVGGVYKNLMDYLKNKYITGDSAQYQCHLLETPIQWHTSSMTETAYYVHWVPSLRFGGRVISSPVVLSEMNTANGYFAYFTEDALLYYNTAEK